MLLSIPYDRGFVRADLDDGRVAAVLQAGLPPVAGDGSAVVAAALRDPIASPPLAELAKGRRNVVVITSDHTRPLPSRITLPPILAEIRRGNPRAAVTILVATGTHRTSTPAEIAEKFGAAIAAEERIVCHSCDDDLVALGRLPSGVPLGINRLAAEADLLVAEGFIEPHFFAGFSGGPKCILPGIAGRGAILANHAGPNIAHPRARTGILAGNPIWSGMAMAADLARLAFILNVVLDRENRVTAAFAGSWREAHARGVQYLLRQVKVPAVPSPITITSNGGYPLDQNLYQAVKGMTAAEATTLPGGRIIAVAACADGLGGEGFAAMLAGMASPAAFYADAARTAPGETPADLWEAQILARVLSKHRVTLVSDRIQPGTKLPPGLDLRASLAEALDEALREAGPEAKVTVIPNGVGVIVE